LKRQTKIKPAEATTPTSGTNISGKALSKRGPKPRTSTDLSSIVVTEMRRGRHKLTGQADDAIPGLEQEGSLDDRQFVSALGRGLAVLAAFRVNDQALGNRDLAERTSLPPATISRLTHTLTQLGYLNFDARRETYDLGGSTLALGHTAIARLNVRSVALPLMQALADRSNANVGLGIRDRQMMIYAGACEGSGLVGLRLYPGSRIPIATSAMGRAYLAGLPQALRENLLATIATQFGSEWPTIRRRIDKAIQEIQKIGFCSSFGEWQKDINGIAVPLVEPSTEMVYVINLGGPAYVLREKEMLEEHGPNLVHVRDQILKLIRPR
jgi:DNA-binding IclR family transcriptional regulator